MRITTRIQGIPPVQNRKPIEVTLDGRKVTAYEGELVSTILLAEGILSFSRKPTTGRPAGVYCGMGVCYECLVRVNGCPNVRACQTYAVDQMVIETAAQGEP